MKFYISFLLLIPCLSIAQKHTPLPHGMVFGSKPEVVNMQQASQLEAYMGKQTRTSVVLVGRVIKVTKPQGGWFDLDAGNGRTISAHFKNFGINLPTDLKGREVIVAGVASKQFSADGRVHQPSDNSAHKPIDLEITGLYVNR